MNKSEEFIDKLIISLDNEEVIKKIKKVCCEDSTSVHSSDKELERLNNKAIQQVNCIENLKRQQIEMSKKYETKLTEYEDKLKEKKLEINKLIEENKKIYDDYNSILNKYEDSVRENICISKELENVKKDSEYYRNTYKELEDYYKKYIMLSEEVKNNLKNVICTANSVMFLCSGVQWDNIDALWHFICYKIKECDEKDIRILKDTFEFFFKNYNSINKIYELLNVNINDDFDEDFHTRGFDSKVSGKITKVLLNGYKNIRTGKVIEKSIVRI